MSIDWVDALRFAGSFLGGSAVGSALTAWIGWGIERRRLKRQQRAQQIENWRKLTATVPDSGGWSLSDPSCKAILKSEHFASLEPHLPKDLRDKIHKGRLVVVGETFPRRDLNAVISALEKKWDLI